MKMLRRTRLAPLLAAALLLAACHAGQRPVTAGKPDAVRAVNARAAIDTTETIRVEALRWAGGAQRRGEISAEQLAQVHAAGEALESAETIANAELAAYLATGTLTAAQALDAALTALLTSKLELLHTKGGG